MQSFNLLEMWRNMALLAKVVNVLLAVCSVYSFWVIVDRLVSLRSVRTKSVRFVVSLRDQLKSRNIDAILQLSTVQSDNPVARVVREAMSEYRDGQDLLRARAGHESEYDAVEAVERVIDRTKEREVADLKRGLGGLASISSAAPFIGLFGTVIGIINAFRAMAATGQGGLGAVSAGISEALFTTAVGLLVAIPAVMTFNYFSTVIERYVVDLNGVGGEIVSFVLREAASAPIASHHSGHPAPMMHGQHSMHPHPSNHPPPVHGSHHPSAHGPASVHPHAPGYPPGYPPR